jgi:hypothetical protein
MFCIKSPIQSFMNHIMRSLVICTAHPILFGVKIEKNAMGGACSAYGGEERLIQGFGGET